MKAALTTGADAPGFEMAAVSGAVIRLSDYRKRKNVVLVMNRGFI